jgi:hypothetical protein
MKQLGTPLDPAFTFGTAEHAANATAGRAAAAHDALQWLTFAHLPEGLRKFSSPFYASAIDLLDEIRTDSDELIIALRKLIEAKDYGMRAGIIHQTGRAGSIPRP